MDENVEDNIRMKLRGLIDVSVALDGFDEL